MALLREQHNLLRRILPPFYATLIVTIISYSLAFRNFLSIEASLYVPAAVITITIMRMVHWYKANKRGQELDLKVIKRDFLGVRWTTTIAIILYSYVLVFSQSNESPHQLAIAISMVWSVAIILSFTVSVLPATSTIFAFSATIPILLNFTHVAAPDLIPLTGIFLVMSLMVIYINRVIYQTFVSTIIARWKLSRKNNIVKSERELANWIAHTDALTGLPNRRSFNTEIEKHLDVLQHDIARSFAVAIVDLDGFKPVNDVHGHAIGDAVLVEVGVRLNRVLQDSGFVARLGGDEFAIIAPDMHDHKQVLELGKRINDSLRPTFHLDGVNAHLSGSCGFHIVRNHDARVGCILERADLALYKAKSGNRGNTEIFSSEMAEQMLRRSLIEQALREAIVNDSIDMYFQPIVDMESRKTIGMEALARWNHPQLGEISPSLFIPIAEHAGLIAELTGKLFEKAILTARTWPDEIFLSFNLSAEHLTRPSAGLNILSALLQHGFPPGRLEIEVTETAIMKDLQQAKITISNLQQAGVRISLDDFGAGYSSMGQIRDLPFDKIKIDKSFVDEVCSSERTRGLVSSIVSMCQNLSICCVAEGIESEDQYQELHSIGCSMGQGYLFSKPVSDSKSTTLFKNNTKQLTA